MLGGSRSRFRVSLGGCVIGDVIAQEIPERDGVGMVMVGAVARLMRVSGIERRAFIYIGVTVPVTRTAVGNSLRCRSSNRRPNC